MADKVELIAYADRLGGDLPGLHEVLRGQFQFLDDVGRFVQNRLRIESSDLGSTIPPGERNGPGAPAGAHIDDAGSFQG